MARIKVEITIDDAYSVEETAAILKVGRATVWRWIKKGKLPYFKLNGKTLVSANAIHQVETTAQKLRAPTDKGALIAMKEVNHEQSTHIHCSSGRMACQEV